MWNGGFREGRGSAARSVSAVSPVDVGEVDRPARSDDHPPSGPPCRATIRQLSWQLTETPAPVLSQALGRVFISLRYK
jgi:hypothetical protein